MTKAVLADYTIFEMIKLEIPMVNKSQV